MGKGIWRAREEESSAADDNDDVKGEEIADVDVNPRGWNAHASDKPVGVRDRSSHSLSFFSPLSVVHQ